MAFASTRGSSPLTQTIVQSGDYIGDMWWYGSDGAAFKEAAFFQVRVDGTPGSGSMPARMIFGTTPSGSVTPLERLRIDSNGRSTFNTIGYSGGNVSIEGAPVAAEFITDTNTSWTAAFMGVNNSGASNAYTATGGSAPNIYTSLGAGSGGQSIMFQSALATDGAAYREAANWEVQTDVATGANSMPGRFIFRTTPSGSVTPLERLRIDSNGRFSTNGFATPPGVFDGTFAQVNVNITSGDWGIAINQCSNSSGNASYFLFNKTRGTTPTTYTILQSGDTIGGFGSYGADGAAYQEAAFNNWYVDAAPSAGKSIPTAFEIFLGTGVSQFDVPCRMRFDHLGSVVVNPNAAHGFYAAIATNATDGFLYIPTCAGTPTGVPTAYAGHVPMVFDTTNSQFWFYTGGAWKQPKTPAGAATVTWQ
jgi:hypothetical protein